MKTVTKYKADDGVEFESEDQCLTHEANCDAAKSIMKNLHKKPSGCDFSNGSGYIKHDAGKVQEVRALFLDFCKRFTDHKCIQGVIDGTTHISHAHRLLGEILPQSIYKHWSRFTCIGSDGREFGQPYYVTNPDEATQKQLN